MDRTYRRDVQIIFQHPDSSLNPRQRIREILSRPLELYGTPGVRKDAAAIGDTPYDAEAAGKAGVATIGVLCGGFKEQDLVQAGCIEVYPGPAGLLAGFDRSMLARAPGAGRRS